VFDQSEDDGRVVLLAEAPIGPDADRARDAVAACPARALTVRAG
jgi:ferredoxin